ncbi:MAG TPA: glycosyltransferase family 39 protein [Kofleriaceae bacterium]|nr:glycosyltransferase family 39 protein [Kofleriaceae bacterium]
MYLLVHAHEPLRLNVGDPWSDANVLSAMSYVKSDGFLATSFADVLDVGPLTSDSYHYIHYPPLAEIFYSAVGKYLGVSDIGTLRLFALAWSGLAMWLLFNYVRRLYSDRIALIATALFATSPLWMMYADSIHQAPVMWATGLLGLWGLIRAIETKQRRHYAAACIGCFGCFFTSYDCYIFLPAAVLVTVYLKAGNPFARGQRQLVALCAGGCVLGIFLKCLTVIGAVGWNEFVADLRLQFFERATTTYERGFELEVWPTLARRLTLVLTPFAWITASYHAIKAIRAPSAAAALEKTVVWMLVVALAFVTVFSELVTSQMLASQVFLPFYAIGSAILIDRLLDSRQALRRFTYVWLAAAPLWSFAILLTHPRSFLEREDVAKTNAYLAANDHNDFVMTNLLSAGHIQAAFQRHAWTSPDDPADPSDAARNMMSVFERTGVDSLYELIFTDPDSRFIDKSIWPLAAAHRWWRLNGWPFLARARTNTMITDYDRRVLKNLESVRAKKVLELSNYAIYRVDRTTVAAVLAESVPSTGHIDFGSAAVRPFLLLGWGWPHLLREEHVAVTNIGDFERCAQPPCKTIMNKYGLDIKGTEDVRAGLLMLRVDQSCDLRLTFQYGTTSYARLSVGGFVQTMTVPARTAVFTVPAANLVHGVNVVELENRLPPGVDLDVASLDIAPACQPAP